MDDTFHIQAHSHAFLRSDAATQIGRSDCDEWRGAFPLVHFVTHPSGDRVWIELSCFARDTATALGGVQVGDGLSDGTGPAGDQIWSLPASLFHFCDHEEAMSIEACIDADDRLLANAR